MGKRRVREFPTRLATRKLDPLSDSLRRPSPTASDAKRNFTTNVIRKKKTRPKHWKSRDRRVRPAVTDDGAVSRLPL